jgi:hypothetical protein
MGDDGVEQTVTERRDARGASLPARMDVLELGSEPGQLGLRDASRVKPRTAQGARIENEADALGHLLEAFGCQGRRRVKRAGRIERVVVVAGQEHPEVTRGDLIEPVPRPGRDRQADTERDHAFRQRPGERDPPPYQSGAVDDTTVLGEGETAGDRRAGHLHRLEPRAVDGVPEVLDAGDGDTCPPPGLRQHRAGVIGRQAIELPHTKWPCCFVRACVSHHH